MGTRSFPRVKQTGRGVDHPPPSNAEVKEIVELYIYTPFGTSRIFLVQINLYLYLSSNLLYND
jgi:hypothetical protein